MTLIKSISGIRGTIGGKPEEGLTPVDIVNFTAAYAYCMLNSQSETTSKTIVVGRDARLSGSMVHRIVIGTLQSMGLDVTDIGLATTPTTEIAVEEEQALGGIIITASHNPTQWNALKLLNSKGEFLSDQEGKAIFEIAESGKFDFSPVDKLGEVIEKDYLDKHIEKVLGLSLVDREAIKNANFKVAIDCVNSVGGLVIPKLLNALGVQTILGLNCLPDGKFPHNPEPLPANLLDLSNALSSGRFDVGFSVDPDVDRLAIFCEDGTPFNEEYTLVAIADYILSQTPGNTVSNLSSTRALRDISKAHGVEYHASAVGEVNVVELMKKTNAVIGGEGNGGVIYPAIHYGRDALVGIALFLTLMAKSKQKVSAIRKQLPPYFMSKQKIQAQGNFDSDKVFDAIKEKYKSYDINEEDNVKIDFPDQWVHLRKSNTEPIIRIYSEAKTQDEADKLGNEFREELKNLITKYSR